MFPGYITLYKDNSANIHLYYFPGISDDGKSSVYMPLDMSKINYDYRFTNMPDGAIDYVFMEKSIKKISASLVDRKTGNTTISTIELDYG